MRIITFVSGKGGSGKTVLVANLGAYVARAGNKVLLIDWDFFTRSLSYYILEGLENLNEKSGLLEAFEDNAFEDITPHSIEKGLDILVPSKYTRRVITFDDVSENLIREKLIEAWGKLLKRINALQEYDFVFVDTHSGSEFLSLIPTFFSNEYILVCEEDRTSWRVSELINNTIKEYSEKLQLNQEISEPLFREPIFGGFILNQTVNTVTEDIIKFLEKQILLGRCIGIIPLDYRVRKAFAKDKLVIEYYPYSSFTAEIRNLSKTYLKIKIPSSSYIDFYRKISVSLIREPSLVLIILLMYMYILSTTIFKNVSSELGFTFLIIFAIFLSVLIIRIIQKLSKE